MLTLDFDQAVDHAARLATHRVVLGITGPPGAGKTTLTQALCSALGAVAVGMDGFHLAHSVLEARGDTERKGAIDTFDGDGYVALLRRIRADGPETIWAPEFRRDIEDAVAGAVAIPARTKLVITEGNYLLVDRAPWNQVRDLCHAIWYANSPEHLRLARLIERHIHYGRSEDSARERAMTGTDALNARIVAATRHRADAWVRTG